MNVLFVCTGNICRSPLAEGILREKFRLRNISGNIDSCGFEHFHTGDPPDHRAQQVARNQGLDISAHRARIFRTADFDRFDKIYVMDSSHYHSIRRLARNLHDMEKVDYIMNEVYPGQNLPVKDPYYDNLDAFLNAYRQLDLACESLAGRVNQISDNGRT